MTIKNILTEPDPFLRQKSLKVEEVNDEVRSLMDDMLATMYNAPGIGLFCPNKQCDVKDGPFEEETIEQPKTILEQHPYLSKPFVNFDVKPMVAPKEISNTEVLIESTKPYKEITPITLVKDY